MGLLLSSSGALEKPVNLIVHPTSVQMVDTSYIEIVFDVSRCDSYIRKEMFPRLSLDEK